MAAPTTIAVTGPALYKRNDRSGDWQKWLDLIGELFTLIAAGGIEVRPGGGDLTAISIDSLFKQRNPLTCEPQVLPYLAQALGFEIDPDIGGADPNKALARKVVSLIYQLHRERGTGQGIVDALRLLLGIEASYRDLWGDAWEIGRSLLGVDTVLAPPMRVPSCSRGTLTGCSPLQFHDNDQLHAGSGSSFVWSSSFEAQTTASAGGEHATGYFTGCSRSALYNGASIIVPIPNAPPISFEFQVDDTFAGRPGFTPIDVRNALYEDPLQTATLLAATLLAHIGPWGYQVDRVGPYVRIIFTAGLTPTIALTGGALDPLAALLPCGGADANPAGFGATPGTVQVNLIGASDETDVAARFAYVLAWNLYATHAVDLDGQTVRIRALTKGTGGDGAIGGAAAVALQATGMAGGMAVSPSVMTFRVDLPYVDDDALRAAQATIVAMKRADAHFILHRGLQYPRDFIAGYDSIGIESRVAMVPDLARPSAVVGTHDVDPWGQSIGRTFTVLLDETKSKRSPQLALDSSYSIESDDDTYVKQGPGQVTATSGDFYLPAGAVWRIQTTSPANAYLGALRVAAGPPAKLRITRAERGLGNA